MAEPLYTEADAQLVAEATEQHHLVTGRTDADGNSPCVCDQWWDSSEGPGWDEHMAEVALDALTAAGWRKLPDVSVGEPIMWRDVLHGGLLHGKVVAVWEDGRISAEFPNEPLPWSGAATAPMTVTAQLSDFSRGIRAASPSTGEDRQQHDDHEV